MKTAILLIFGITAASAFISFLAATVGVWMLDKIVIAILNWHKSDPDSNTALRNWLLCHPGCTIDDFLEGKIQ